MAQSNTGKRFLGSGLAFPFALNSQARLAQASEEQKVAESIRVILGTARGERAMRPEFGSRLRELVFEPMNASTRSRIAHYVGEALLRWEHRIEVLGVEVGQDPASRGALLVNIAYRVKATNSTFNLVYPFHLQEGSGATS